MCILTLLYSCYASNEFFAHSTLPVTSPEATLLNVLGMFASKRRSPVVLT